MGLGPTHTVSLAEARQKALEGRRLLLDGVNPLLARNRQQVAAKLASSNMMTFDQCAEGYILAQRAGWKNEKHANQWSSTLKTYASPVFGALPVGDVDTGLVVKCLAPIWEKKTETATRVRGRIESVLGWATTSGYRSGENPARWKGHLENLLATISKTKRTKNHPALPWQQAGAFVHSLRGRAGVAAQALELLILTACRSGDVRGAQWGEFDLDERLWTIPASRIKAGREHQIPLSDAAVRVVEALPKVSNIVFPGTRGQPLSDMTLTAVIRRMRKDDLSDWVDTDGARITVHGFRTTFRMWAAEMTDYPREVAEHSLAHQLPDAVERAYQRGSHFTKRTSLMADWANYCATDRSASSAQAKNFS
ncbi:MAG: site-specific integrase [SAR86 cluster bacterium]|uniref:Site-specific integrase n=1 Tax=SAR86 cluster bacterium TaxID=2030880 RepID=A0A973A7K0_9GAMM|nr:site-specific integrase [SAR86 cluster bacterium]